MHHILGTNSLWRRLRKFCQWNIAWLADSQRSIAEFLVQYWHQEVMVSGSNVPSLGSHHGGAVVQWVRLWAAILKNRKIVISPPHFDRFRPNLAQWRIGTLLSCSTIKISKISKYKMTAAAILKNRKIVISPLRFDRFRPNLARRHISTLLSCPTIKISKIYKSKMATAAILKNRKIATYLLKFGRFRPNFVWRHSSSVLSCPTIKKFKF